MFMHIGMVVMQREYHKLIYNGNPFIVKIAKKFLKKAIYIGFMMQTKSS